MSDLLDKCEVCGALIDEEDLFCANCGTAAPHPPQDTDRSANVWTHSFQCGGCGASMSYDASARALACPFCGQQRLQERPDTRSLSPRRVVPFALDQNAAVARLRKWLGRGFWRPGDLSSAAVVHRMAAVYVPYWSFSARTHTYWTADSSRTPPGARASWYPLWGEHRGEYRGLLIGASGALSPAETHAICPFDLARAVKPDEVDLENATLEQFRVQRKYARPLARAGIEQLERQTCQSRYVPGSCRNMKVNVRVEGQTSEPILLPVWIMAYRYRDQTYRFLVNGQTGKATGKAPISYKKIALAVGIALALLAGLVLVRAAAGG